MIRLIFQQQQLKGLMETTEQICDSLGICLHCAGHSQGACFCSTLFVDSSITPQFISMFTCPNPNPQKKTSRQLRKDNDSHKRLSTVLKSIYRMLMGEKIDKKYRLFYYRQDFVFLILSLLEKNGKLIEACAIFTEKINAFKFEIKQELVDEPVYLEELNNLIKRYELAIPVWIEGNHKQSMKIIYDYDHMRQKQKFEKAVKYIQQIRTDKGLPFAE